MSLDRCELHFNFPYQPLISQVVEYLHRFLVMGLSLFEVVFGHVDVGDGPVLFAHLQAVLPVNSLFFLLNS